MIRSVLSIALSISLTSSSASAAILKMGTLSPYYQNLANLEHGTTITSTAEAAPGYDLRSIIDPSQFPGPDDNGMFRFADKDQREVFIIDLGRIRTSGLAVIRTHSYDGPIHGDPDNRRPRQMIIQASPDGNEESWQELRSCIGKENVPRKQSIVWEDKPIRFLRFDLGRNTDGIGSSMSYILIYRRYKFPPLDERLGDINNLLKPDIPELKSFRSALADNNLDRAIAALRHHFGHNRFTIRTISSPHDSSFEEWKHNKVSYNGRVWKIPGNRFDWHYFPCDLSHEPPSYWVAGRQFWYVANYYKGTKDEKYIRSAAKMIRQWMTDLPCPGVHTMPFLEGRDIMNNGWPAIRVANRAYGLTASLVTFAPFREKFDDQTWVELLYSIWEHTQFLAHVVPDLGGNWLTWANERLLVNAKRFPEYRDQKSWLQIGQKEFERVVLDDVSDDGKECEDTTFYCIRAIDEIIEMDEVFEEFGIALSPKVKARVRNALDFPAWVTQPDFRKPAIGDMGMIGTPRKSIQLIDRYASKWNRDDLIYINTRGREGTKPKLTSRAFLDDGWFIMRSDWDDGLDARHLVFRAPPDGCRGHGHRDVLAMVLYAYGRPLLIDSGRTLYGIKGSTEYCHTNAHNTVTIDKKSQKHGPGKVHHWESTSAYDFVDAEHSLYEGITHRRKIIFVKPDYYIIIDNIMGQGEHTLDWNYHFLEKANPTQIGGIIRTNFSTGGNLSILPVPWDEVTESNPKSFTYVSSEIKGGKEVPSKGWRVRIRNHLPQRLITILLPFKGTKPPADLQVDLVQPHIIKIQHDQNIDLVAWKPPNTKETWSLSHQGSLEQVSKAIVVRRAIETK